MRLFFDSTISNETKTHFLSEEESKHACKVLRLSEGDSLAIVNGKGLYVETKIIVSNPKKCQVEVVSAIEEEAPRYNIHIAIAPTKMNDRLEWFVEKATELGVTEITFLLTKNSERKQIKFERFENIAISAMKQSKRLFLPKLNELTPINTFIDKNPNGLIAACYEGEKTTVSSGFVTTNCPILIGPEGDFTVDEFERAQKNGYKSITLGKNRLRTETAGLYACMQALMIINP